MSIPNSTLFFGFRFPSRPGHRFKLRQTIGLALVLFASTALLLAEPAETAHLRGTVTDPAGALVPGAKRARAQSHHRHRRRSHHQPRWNLFDPASRRPLRPGVQRVRLPNRRPQGSRCGRRCRRRRSTFSCRSQRKTSRSTSPLNSPGVETTSSQLGETISAAKMTSVPLNGRSFTDLLAIQPGVIPASSQQPNAVVMSGCSATPPSGDLNPGNLSVSGQRETSNGFSVNGSNVEEDFNNGTAIVPNLDSIQDFKVLTSNFDAEYGNFGGGQVLVNTKSGGNQAPRQRLRVPPQHRPRLAQLLRPHPRHLRPQPVRRNPRRPHPQRQNLLLPRLPGHRHDPRPGDRKHRRPQPRRTQRQFH